MYRKKPYWILALLAALVLAGCNRNVTPPKPGPDEDTRPEPPQAAVSCVVLYDAAATDDLGIYADPAIADYMASQGHQYRIHATATVDETGKPPKYLQPYLESAKGKQLPLVLVGRNGKVKSTLEKPADSQAVIRLVEKAKGESPESNAIWAGGHWRPLGGIKPARPGAGDRFPQEGDGNEPLIPEEQWQDRDLGPTWDVVDQNGYSSCCPSGANGIYECFAKNRTGLKPFNLSVLDLYARINGGRDSGAMLDDALEEFQSKGVCTVEYCKEQGWKKPDHQSGYETSRAKHRVTRATWCKDWPAIASAIQRRKPVLFGVLVDSRFSPDEKGMIGRKRGRDGGGHAVAAVGMRKVQGEWYILMLNSWGTKWGGAKDGSVRPGCCLLHHSYIEPMFGAWAIGAIVSPSDDPISVRVRPEQRYLANLWPRSSSPCANGQCPTMQPPAPAKQTIDVKVEAIIAEAKLTTDKKTPAAVVPAQRRCVLSPRSADCRARPRLFRIRQGGRGR